MGIDQGEEEKGERGREERGFLSLSLSLVLFLFLPLQQIKGARRENRKKGHKKEDKCFFVFSLFVAFFSFFFFCPHTSFIHTREACTAKHILCTFFFMKMKRNKKTVWPKSHFGEYKRSFSFSIFRVPNVFLYTEMYFAFWRSG